VLLFFAVRGIALLFLIFSRRAPAAEPKGSVRLRRRSARGSNGLDSSALDSTAVTGAAMTVSASRPVRTMVVLGSGGHTTEMLAVLEAVPRAHYAPLLFVRAATDAGSEARARSMETARGNQHVSSHFAIPRSREVGQSYVTSVWSTLRALAHSVHVVWQYKPELVSERFSTSACWRFHMHS
jgi:hypothetical protein